MNPLLSLPHQLALYKAHHLHPTNVGIHLFCIPLILATAMILLSPYSYIVLPISVTYCLYYLTLNIPAGVISSLYIILSVQAGHFFYSNFFWSTVTLSALTVHILSWAAQFYAHFAHEKSAPAVFAHPVQPLVLAPYFVVFELFFHFGFYSKLEEDMMIQAKALRASIDSSKSK